MSFFTENRDEIQRAFENLQPGSSTNMIAGLHRVYDLAQNNFDNTMLQRVILLQPHQASCYLKAHGPHRLEYTIDLPDLFLQEV